MKRVNRMTAVSFSAALVVWALLSLLSLFIIRGYRDRARLIRDNENERIFTSLFTSLRDYDDFGSAIEASGVLKERIAGIAVYGQDLLPLYRWGRTPGRFDPALLREPPQRFSRYTIDDRRSRSVILVIHNDRPPPDDNRGAEFRADARGEPRSEARAEPRSESRNGETRQRNRPWPWSPYSGGYFYTDITHNDYWNTMYITAALYPVSTALLLFLTLAVRRLYLRNIEYRRRIESQKNLVVLGTAASTLAHEIRNPLHSIKLQTAILKKISEGVSGWDGAEEIARIEEEIDRLAALTYRVNDYLRDPRGSPGRINPAEIINDISSRLCERFILGGEASPLAPAGKAVLRYPPLFASMDSERARSLFENIIRNALESGGPPEEVRAEIQQKGTNILITIEDRGRGIAPEDLSRVFDPFYTSKSAGTGIGLAISRRFAEAAGGSVALAARPGGGTTAAITLPATSPLETISPSEKGLGTRAIKD